jgi:hypothetical protein
LELQRLVVDDDAVEVEKNGFDHALENFPTRAKTRALVSEILNPITVI